MASVDQKRLLDNLRIRLPGALDDTIKLEICNVVETLTHETGCWTEEIEFDVNLTETEYDVQSSQGEVVRLLYVREQNEKFQIDASMPVPGVLLFQNPFTTARTLVAKVVLTPKSTPDREGLPVVPGWIMSQYYDTILDGTLARMMSQMGKPYSSPQGAVFHMNMWTSALGRIRGEVTRANLQAGQRWRFPQSFRSYRMR